VRHDQRGARTAAVRRLDHLGDAPRVGGVEAGRRLVVEDQVGVERERARERDALQLPAAQVAQPAGAADAEPVEEVARRRDLALEARSPVARHRAVARAAAVAQREEDVLPRRELVEERVVLEEDPDAAGRRRLGEQVGRLVAQRPVGRERAGAGPHHAGEQLEQDRLAGAARRAEERDLAAPHGEVGRLEQRRAAHPERERARLDRGRREDAHAGPGRITTHAGPRSRSRPAAAARRPGRGRSPGRRDGAGRGGSAARGRD